MKKEPSIKPMRGEKVDFAKLRFPCVGSPKIDGLRGMCMNNQLLSKTMKLIPNRYTQSLLSDSSLEGFDGELTPGATTHPNLMQMSMSAFMSHDGSPEVTFTVFDLCNHPELSYRERYKLLRQRVLELPTHLQRHVVLCPVKKLESMGQLEVFERECLEQGFEGIMVRDPEGKYKYGKSTANEQYLLKLKRWDDGEFVVDDVEFLFSNQNEATTDEMGYTKRSTKKEGMVQQKLVGALLGKDTKTGQLVRAGSGLTAALREQLYDDWNNGTLSGKLVTYKHFNVTGVKDSRRFAIFKTIRHPDDISEE